LDEVGEMPLDLQAKLLRVLQEGEVQPVGSSKVVRVDVRVIAATNRDLEEAVRRGAFRRDLFYRLNVFPLRIPALRDRGDDVLLLAEAFALRLAKNHRRELAPLTQEDRARLRRYDWPGNVRELHNVIERAFITSADGHRLNLARALTSGPGADGEADGTARWRGGGDTEYLILTAPELRDLERRSIENALEKSNGKISGLGGAAGLLRMNPNTLASRMKALGLRPAHTPRTRESDPEIS
jgi:transcriptional regulator with GAF, ATPase, and Fis domain